MKNGANAIIAMLADNTAGILEATYHGLARDLVDDVSHHETVDIAERQGIKTLAQLRNRGYDGANRTAAAGVPAGQSE